PASGTPSHKEGGRKAYWPTHGKAGAMKTLGASLFVLALTGCGGTNAGLPVSPQAPAVRIMPDHSAPLLYTANRDGASVLAFKSKANGNVAPVVTISGSNTTLSDPDALAVDKKGRVYAANDGANQVAVFAPGANGNATPSRLIGGSKSHLGPTEGILVDPAGHLWVSDYVDSVITEYSAKA